MQKKSKGVYWRRRASETKSRKLFVSEPRSQKGYNAPRLSTLYFFSLMLGLAFIVVACTPYAQQQATGALTEGTPSAVEDNTQTDVVDDSDTSLKVPAPGVDPDSVDEMIVDDGDAIESQTKEFNVGGGNFAFSAREIRVKKGDTVTLNFTSTGGLHDWTVSEFSAAAARVNSGASSSVTFVADKTGTFEYYCSVGTHRALGMVGRLIVE